ncbi:hypothetical protein BIV59_04295 [Bacillus sp. MUM 13]|nr:hypothetical protein BIV59_04295 [Bacillus sp. MUM 13]
MFMSISAYDDVSGYGMIHAERSSFFVFGFSLFKAVFVNFVAIKQGVDFLSRMLRFPQGVR